jgi:Putative Tad-like Flp pilus-assembly
LIVVISPFAIPTRWLTSAAAEEDGGMSIFGIFMFATMAVIGGIALDVSHLYSATDIAAHAALYSRDSMSADDAKAAALAAVINGMPEDDYGIVLEASDIVFGTYDYETETFTADPDASEAVLVTASRLAENNNAAESYLWRLIGIDSFDIQTESVFTTFRPM